MHFLFSSGGNQPGHGCARRPAARRGLARRDPRRTVGTAGATGSRSGPRAGGPAREGRHHTRDCAMNTRFTTPTTRHRPRRGLPRETSSHHETTCEHDAGGRWTAGSDEDGDAVRGSSTVMLRGGPAGGSRGAVAPGRKADDVRDNPAGWGRPRGWQGTVCRFRRGFTGSISRRGPGVCIVSSPPAGLLPACGRRPPDAAARYCRSLSSAGLSKGFLRWCAWRSRVRRW